MDSLETEQLRWERDEWNRIERQVSAEIEKLTDQEIIDRTNTMKVCIDFAPGQKREVTMEIRKTLLQMAVSMEVFEEYKSIREECFS